MTARQAALISLERCRRDGAWSSAAIDGAIRGNSLERRDAALATALTLCVLQNKKYIDFIIDSFCTTRANRLEKKVLDLLRLGVAQLLFFSRIPPRAAVNETVALCASAGVARASSLVNAVLRRISGSLEELPEVPGKGSAEYLSTRYSHPLWLAEKLCTEKGYDFTEALFRCNNMPSALDVQINTLRTDPESFTRSLRKADIEYEIPPFPAGCVSIAGGAVRALPGYEGGEFFVQDRAARMAVEIAGIEPGMDVLDACACPGGKSFAAAIDMCDKGSVLSCDISEKKLSLVEDGAKKLGISCISTQRRDARTPAAELEGRFDVVIADVPCSGFGVIGKKPEIRDKNAADIAALPAIQSAIISNVSRFVKRGGILLYSTCTILREENEDIIHAFLDASDEFEPVDYLVSGRSSERGCYTFYPNIDGTDGFFTAKLRRKE